MNEMSVTVSYHGMSLTVPITTKVVSLNPTQVGCTQYNVM